MRRTVLTVLLVATLTLGAAAAKGPGPHAGHGAGRGCPGGPAAMAEARDTFHALLGAHQAIRRSVEEIEGGVATMTTSEDPEVAAKIREHVGQMKSRVESGQGLRHWDPLFVEIFEHHEEIVMVIENVPGGVRVRETSSNPEVSKLIRAHARAVSEFAECGFERAHEASALPWDYGKKPPAAPSPKP